MRDFKVSVVIPSYNEEDNINALVDRLVPILSHYPDYEILLVDDGSADNTLEIIQRLSEQHDKVKYLSFSRNFGHQMALKAGLDHATGDCVICMDADLQHPPELIDQMIGKWKEGYDVVYTVREDGTNVPFLKKGTARLFYTFINRISNIKLDRGVADFRLLDRSVVEVFRNINESSLFIRGLVSWVGFKQCAIKYLPENRFSGESKYSYGRMVSFALDGITSFSVKPLHLATLFGMAVSLLSFLYGLFAIFMHFFTNRVISGWTSVIVSVLFIGGLQLLMLGILGEYLGKLFIESKKRPIYIIRKKKL
jgi:glycosyltransferase involved in cell wall biosynthesis